MITALTHLTLSWKCRKAALSNERGMTLIELMVATLVFAVISASTMIALGGAL